MTGTEPDSPGLARPELVRVLESAARLQDVVPDAVLVGGSAAALWANHRHSHDHDHVLQDLSDRFDTVLEAIEATDGWVTNRVTPGKIILGEGLDARWTDWGNVTDVCRSLAVEMVQ